jgi:tetratricopeptide (TPR) repeat protein
MAYDVFVSYSSQDKPTADAIVASLEANGIRCWIAPRDILPGTDWSEAIVDAIEEAATMVLVFSGHANNSPQIRREIERAVDTAIPVLPVRIEDILPSRSLQYFIGPQHWLDAWTPPLEQHLHRLTETVKALLSKRLEGFDAARREPGLKLQTDPVVGGPASAAAEPPPPMGRAETPVGRPPSPARKFSGTAPLILAGLLVAAALGGGAVWWLGYHPGAPPGARAPAVAPKEGNQRPAPPEAPAKPSVKDMTAEDYFNKGQAAKDPQEKIGFYNQAIELNPKYAEAYNYRGNAYFDKKMYDIALSDYNKAISLNPNYANPYINLGNYYANVKKEYDRALQEYDKAITLSPKDARIYSKRGVVYDKKNDSEKALRDYNKALELDQNLSDAYFNRGELYSRKKELDKAIQDFNKAIELNQSDAVAYVERGALYMNKKEYKKALRDFNEGITLDKSCEFGYTSRGTLYYIKAEYDKALQDFNKAIELDQNSSFNYFMRGGIYNLKKEYGKVLQDYNKAIELDPSFAEAYIYRASVYITKKEYNKALKDYDRAIELNPDDHETYLKRKNLKKQMR